MIGFAASPGTDVEPDVLDPTSTSEPSVARMRAASCSNDVTHASS